MKFFFISLLLILPFQTRKEVIEIEGLTNKYQHSGSVKFIITNNDLKTLSYYVGIECLENGHWSELIGNIENPRAKSGLIKKIQPKQKINTTFSIRETFFAKNFLNFEKYRLIVTYWDNSDSPVEHYRSKSFDIVKD